MQPCTDNAAQGLIPPFNPPSDDDLDALLATRWDELPGEFRRAREEPRDGKAWDTFDPAKRLAIKLGEIADRYKAKAKRKGESGRFYLNTIALRDVNALVRHRYGDVLPDSELGRAFVFVIAALMASKPAQGKSLSAGVRERLAKLAPWLSESELIGLYHKVTTRAWRWKAETLGRKLGVSQLERDRLGLTQMRSIDGPKPKKLRRLKAQQRSMRNRDAKGVRPRSQYLATSKARTQPWKVEGISRRTWYRRHAVAQVRSHPIETTGANAGVPPKPVWGPRQRSIGELNAVRARHAAPPLGQISLWALGHRAGDERGVEGVCRKLKAGCQFRNGEQF